MEEKQIKKCGLPQIKPFTFVGLNSKILSELSIFFNPKFPSQFLAIFYNGSYLYQNSAIFINFCIQFFFSNLTLTAEATQMLVFTHFPFFPSNSCEV